MKKIKISIFTILTLLIVGITFNSCTTEEVNTKENATVNKVEFNDLAKKAESNDVLDDVIFDGIPANEFIANNGIDKVSFINLINEKSDEMYSYTETFSKKKKLSCEEIRDAMIKECQNGYCCGLDDACEIAVKIAYHIKVMRGGCPKEITPA